MDVAGKMWGSGKQRSLDIEDTGDTWKGGKGVVLESARPWPLRFLGAGGSFDRPIP
jgi:hypothetical protein